MGKGFLKRGGMRVLEPMCGYAEGKKILESHLGIAISYEGFDSSENFVNLVKKEDPSIIIREMDVTEFTASGVYDLVILIGGLHHVYRSAGEVVCEISRSLKNKGYFINFEATSNNVIARKIGEVIYRKNAFFDYETEKRFTLEELNKVYEEGGFEIADQIYPGLLSYVLYYNPDVFPLLNVGRGTLVRLLFSIDKHFFRNFIGRRLSFATLTLLQKKDTDV